MCNFGRGEYMSEIFLNLGTLVEENMQLSTGPEVIKLIYAHLN